MAQTEQAVGILGIDTQANRLYPPTLGLGWDPLRNFDRGPINAQSYSNYNQSVILSGLHKSLNRGFSLEAVKWGLEQFYTNKVVRGWSWNVLLEYSLDSIGPADPTAFLRVNYLKINFPERPEAYITAVLILAQAKKTNVILFANLLYPELKIKGVSERLAMNIIPELVQPEFDAALQQRNLTRGIYAIYALANFEKQLFSKRYDTYNPIALIYESFTKIYPTNQPTYTTLLLEAAVQENWRWEPRSMKIYLMLLHLHCTNNIPTISVIQQFPADNVQFLDKMFRDRQQLISYFGPADYQLDLSTDEGRKQKATKESWIRNVSVLANEDPNWAPLSNFYKIEVGKKKSKKIR